jgi:hypothetical protein
VGGGWLGRGGKDSSRGVCVGIRGSAAGVVLGGGDAVGRSKVVWQDAVKISIVMIQR